MTKYRKVVITTERGRTLLKEAFSSVCSDLGAQLRKIDGEDDHVHLLAEAPPKIAPSVLVNSLKGVSSRRLRSANFSEIRRKLWSEHFWSPSYFVSSAGGATHDVIKAYIQNQRARTGSDSFQP